MIEFIPADKQKKDLRNNQYELADIYKVVASHADRLGIDRERAFENAIVFADIVGTMENDGKLEGKNPTSTAKGLYQFIDGSVGPAAERLGRHLDYPWIEEAKEHKDANRLTWNQQTLLFLADLLEKKESDKFMKNVLERGDMESMKEAYMELHHTAPDEATKRRAEGIFHGTKD